MDNFTPLKTEKGKKANKFLIFGNLFLVVIIAVVGVLYYNKTLITTKQKAEETLTPTPISIATTAPTHLECRWCDDKCVPWADDKACIQNTPPKDKICVYNRGGDSTRSPGCEIIDCTKEGQGLGAVTQYNNNQCCSGLIEVYPTSSPNEPALTGARGICRKSITATPVITATLTSTPTGTPGSTATPIPVLCGTKSCDNATNPCRSNYVCVQANDGSNYCSSPDFVTACKANPSYDACCIAPGAPTATPTEIIIASVSASPTAIVNLPVTGTIKSIIYIVPALIIIAGLIL